MKSGQEYKGNRAAGYIRVSTERQATAASPEEQELDIRRLAEKLGLNLVHIYRDIEKYRAGGKMVEPSGSRSDRPQFRKMMADADKGLFDVVLAWRQDRLYRGINAAALDIADRVKNGVFAVELVNDRYDPKTAMLMAWAGGIELEARSDRMAMGRRARFKEGKHWGYGPYGYDLDPNTKKLVINPQEAAVVLEMFERSAAGQSANEIRGWLIAAGIKQRRQKGGPEPWHGYEWAPWTIRQILYRSDYATGIQIYTSDGEQYEIPCPVIVPMHVYKAVLRRRENYKKTKTGHFNQGEFLFVGKVYCGVDQIKMNLKRVHQENKHGGYIYYRCTYRSFKVDWADGCAGMIRAHRIEDRAWDLVYREISTPGKLEMMVEARILELEQIEDNAAALIQDLESKLARLEAEKQKIYTWVRTDFISQKDAEPQLAEVKIQIDAIQRDLTAAKLDTDRHSDDLRSALQVLRQDMAGAVVALSHPPQDEDEAAYQWKIKKHLVDNFVSRILVFRPQWHPGYKPPKIVPGTNGGKNGPPEMEIDVKVEMAVDLETFVISEGSL